MIQIEGLKKEYSGFTLDLSMLVPAGRVSGLVGRNGAGKSTTIKAILGLIRPDAGSVKVFGKDSTRLTPADKYNIGAAMSEAGFSSLLNIRDTADILAGMYPGFNKKQYLDTCTGAGLPLDKKIKEFSTGMKAKLRVLVALSHKAKLLVLDEPTAGLDVEARMEILDMIRDYLAENEDCSILISSHISSDLEGLCDDLYMIHDGKVVLHEDTDRILSSYGVIKTDEAGYETLDKEHILGTRKESFGYSCFTDERQYYEENYPGLVVEKGSIDDMILILGGKKR